MARKIMNRRGFLAAGGGLALGGATLPAAVADAEGIAWDRTADVVVVGYGGAGAAAAITAHDAGARVVILEKTAAGGGSTRYSGGFFVSPRSVEGAADYLMACAAAASGRTFDMRREDLLAWAEEATGNADWFRSLGGDPFATLRGWYDVPGAEDYITYQPRGDSTGVGLWQVLADAVAARGIEVIHEAPAERLVMAEVGPGPLSPRRVVQGVVAAGPAGPVAVGARRAVILACGGFDHDETFKASYLRTYPAHSVGHTGNTGDAIRLAAAAGAALWRLTGTSATLCHRKPGAAVANPSALQISAAARSMILVNRQGRRFVNEALNYDAVAKMLANVDPGAQSVPTFPNTPCWALFDDKARAAGPVGFPVPFGAPEYDWSSDNAAEIAAGVIRRAGTLAELAAATGTDPDALTATVETYNAHCAAGTDPDFGRSLGLLPLEGPPWYAVEGHFGLWATGGGPRINARAQVVDPAGAVIPRLYTAGSASSFCFSHLYPLSGTAIGDCLAMGRIAGRHAAAESPA